ncbi:MAG: histidine kinase [Firmicutes bacterium]|nr:histidine kinase [Bacillota bacterium]
MNKIKNIWFNIRYFKFNSIFLRTFLFITTLTVIPFIVLSIMFYSNTLKNIREEITLENSYMFDNSVNIIDRTLMEVDTLSSSLASNESTQLYTINNVSTDSFKTISRLAKTLPIIYRYIDSIYIYSEQTDTVIMDNNSIPLSDLSDTDWINAYRAVTSPKGTIIPRSKNNVYPQLITIIKPIYVADEKKGAIIMNINAQSIYNSMLYQQYKDGRLFFLVNADNKIIISSELSYFNTYPDDIGLNTLTIESNPKNSVYEINDKNYVVLSGDSSISDYKYISAYPLELYEHKLSTMKLQIIGILLLLMIIIFILAYVASVRSYSPLNEIISFLDNSQPPADSIEEEDKNELMYIINSIQTHINDKTKMAEILEERMKLLRKSQYDMLQTQINPHFLYNTLETINWMAYNMSNSENPVSKSLINLASFFRNTLTSGYFVSIENEIKYTKEYVNILALRYGDLFDIEWDIDESILSYTIIKICLQPIIENAVYHGIKQKNDKGLIKIKGLCDDNNIILIVSDDGIGIEKDALDELNKTLSETSFTNEKSHIGLSNVNQRIKIIFGDSYGIHVESTVGVGTDVYVTIPKKEQ